MYCVEIGYMEKQILVDGNIERRAVDENLSEIWLQATEEEPEKLLWRVVGGDVNRKRLKTLEESYPIQEEYPIQESYPIDDIILEKTSREVNLAGETDPCTWKLSYTKFKVGIDDGTNSEWHLGMKDPLTLVQYLLKIEGLYGSNDQGTWTKLELLNPNVSLTDELEMSRCFIHCDIQFIPQNAGIIVKHRFYKQLAEIFSNYQYFGIRWDVNDAGIMDELAPSTNGVATEFFKNEDEKYFVEYFDKDAFGDNEYIEHDYSNKSGLITTATWTAGTYEIDGAVTVDNQLTLDCSSGYIYLKFLGNTNNIKTVVGGSFPRIVQTNGAPDARVVLTSMNDDYHGEKLVGTYTNTSTGNPSWDDIQMSVIDCNAAGATEASSLALDWWELHYATCNTATPLIGFNGALQQHANPETYSFYLKNGTVQNCLFDPPIGGTEYSMIGIYGPGTNGTKAILFENIHIGESNACGLNASLEGGTVVNTYRRIIGWSSTARAVSPEQLTIKNCTIKMKGSTQAGIYARSYFGYTGGLNILIENNIVVGAFAAGCIRIDDRETDEGQSTVIRNNVLSNSYPTDDPTSEALPAAGIFSYVGSTQ